MTLSRLSIFTIPLTTNGQNRLRNETSFPLIRIAHGRKPVARQAYLLHTGDSVIVASSSLSPTVSPFPSFLSAPPVPRSEDWTLGQRALAHAG
ncbi:hypothetical protein JMJ77_0011716 [Colletotrichum scovillei]|uniref:Uncharacterized protein n=1 Tax=Colletotrichum scovillei TaxID=1209932 RepID=A0A9P7QUX7_9PEZI|nr:hypothetical protein JMJ77_0011716 [Colletotrichum scovillei]KAG7045996.1 hypothetical protein JMJ78_0011066 [Colletotrichum scovillei]KAG7063344.1 hypothetical protein JMJ76_0005811 [Colletotrichum scovillei]